MRGKVFGGRSDHVGYRITPAYAGKSTLLHRKSFCAKDHPRVCGEKSVDVFASFLNPGSPPRMRGKDPDNPVIKQRLRITPAYAGKRQRSGRKEKGTGDHPRVCGEKGVYALLYTGLWGSPPRMRGKVRGHPVDIVHSGITPAYAGKSAPKKWITCGRWDHPRVCGEKRGTSINAATKTGSPPRMRGKV